MPSCVWCNQPFRAREGGGRAQRFCRPSCRRAFHAAARAWALKAIEMGGLTIADTKSGLPATRALRRLGEGLPPLPGLGSPDDALAHPLTRFLVEVPRSTIEVFVRFGFIRSDQRDDLAAIMRCGA